MTVNLLKVGVQPLANSLSVFRKVRKRKISSIVISFIQKFQIYQTEVDKVCLDHRPQRLLYCSNTTLLLCNMHIWRIYYYVWIFR